MKAIQERKISRRVEFISSLEKDSKVELKTAVFHYIPCSTTWLSKIRACLFLNNKKYVIKSDFQLHLVFKAITI